MQYSKWQGFRPHQTVSLETSRSLIRGKFCSMNIFTFGFKKLYYRHKIKLYLSSIVKRFHNKMVIIITTIITIIIIIITIIIHVVNNDDEIKHSNIVISLEVIKSHVAKETGKQRKVSQNFRDEIGVFYHPRHGELPPQLLALVCQIHERRPHQRRPEYDG